MPIEFLGPYPQCSELGDPLCRVAVSRQRIQRKVVPIQVILQVKHARKTRAGKFILRPRAVGLLPFDHDRQLVSATARTPAGGFALVTKGAPEAVLRRCVDVPEEATSTVERLFAEGARVVAVATREVDDAGAYRIRSCYLVGGEQVDQRRRSGRLKPPPPR